MLEITFILRASALEILNSKGDLIFRDPDKKLIGKGEAFLASDVNMVNCDFSGAHFRNVSFQFGDIGSSMFKSARFEDVEMEGTWMNDTDFHEATFSGVEFYFTTGYASKWRQSKIEMVKFFGANLSKADFREAHLMGVGFVKDNVGGKCSLNGVNFALTIFEDVSFDGATYDGDTIFPVGFDPERTVGLTYDDSVHC
ncbi:MAG: pentapeptide repeat-containing protein [Pseudomonadota bacterium]